jgi:2-iminobutanoate/2-iminopropanoate deaminase
MTKTVVHTDRAPAPVGGAPYSQAITAGGLVFTAGQVGLDGDGNLSGDVAAQTHRTFDNLTAILEAAGTGLDRVVKTTVFMSDLGEFGAMNAVYAERMPSPFPARSTVQVAKLPADAKVEIEVVALA